MNPKETLLIITSSVFVSSPLTKITDPKEREKQYINSILFYLNETNINKIVICDNSGFEYSYLKLGIIAQQQNKKIELLSFKGDAYSIEKLGKGYGEGEIMKFILKNSRLLKDKDFFFKVTGRIIIKNINQIIKSINPSLNYFQTIREVLLFSASKVDTRFYFCNKHIFNENLLDIYYFINDLEGYYLEHIYYRALERNKIQYNNFKFYPNYVGISGSSGMSYNESLIKRIIKQLISRFFSF